MFSRLKSLLIYAFVMMIFAFTANAETSPLYDYHVRIHEASLILTALSVDDEDYSARTQKYISATLYDVRAMLPPGETVEWKGALIQTNNAWLHEELHERDKLEIYDSKRKQILMRLAERLSAIDDRLTELDGQKLTDQKSSTRFPVDQTEQARAGGQSNGPQTFGGQINGATGTNASRKPLQGQPIPNAEQTRNKEAEKAKMNEILSRDEFSKKPPEKSAMQKFWDWLMKREKKEEKEEEKEPQIQLRPVTPFVLIIQYVLIGILFAAIGFVIWKLAPRLLRRDLKKKKEKPEPRVILGETLKEDETASDLLSEADRLARAGDVRAAIRKAYIAMLCELSDKKLVHLAQNKTNRDYLRDVRNKWILYAQMEQMTNSFERHWYGFEPTTENDWNNFRTSYQQALNQGTTN